MSVSSNDIKLFLRGKGISQEDVAKTYGISRQTLSNYLKMANPPDDFVQFVKREYGYALPNEVYGTGQNSVRLIETSEDETIVTKTGMQFIPNRDGSYTMLTPHVTEYGYQGYMRGFSDIKYISELPVFPIRVTELHRGAYLTFTMLGDSMDDGTRESFADGDILTGRFIQRHLWETDRLHYKKHRFFIIHAVDGIIMKEIIDHDVEGKRILIHSLNPDKESYPDEWINLNNVKELFNVTHRSTKL